MLYLAAVRGPLIIVFALAGLFISVFYVAPPIRLKHHGLGEPGVFLVWGPLMIGGTFLAATGTIPGWVLLVSVPYALLVTSVLFGKHIDKIEADSAIGVRTLPVILGEARARTVGSWLMIAFYPLTLLAVVVGLRRAMGAPRGPRHPAAAERAQGLRQAEAAGAAARLPGARLAALVRGVRLRPYPTGGRAADPGAAAQRDRADHAALALAGTRGPAAPTSRALRRRARPRRRDGRGIRAGRAW